MFKDKQKYYIPNLLFRFIYYWNGAAWVRLPGSVETWSLTGNAGTSAATNFIGTTDNVNLVFKLNNEKSGAIDAFGTLSTSLGYQSLSNGTGNYNCAFGYQSMKANTSGAYNASYGCFSMPANTTGGYNAAFGYKALFSNQSGINNTAIGYVASNSNISGLSNTAVGYAALYKSTAHYNTGVGDHSFFNTTASHNTGIGYNSGLNTSWGGGNTAIGEAAMDNNTTGTNNTALGYLSDVSSTNLTNATSIGFNAQVNASNKVQIGDGNITAVQLGIGTNVTLETGLVKITGGTPGAGKVLTSDAAGLASWTSVSKTNFAAVASPTANDDSTTGYTVGSMWIDTVLDDAYICVDNTIAAAIWKKITP